mgnify:CR=1 FL=1
MLWCVCIGMVIFDLMYGLLNVNWDTKPDKAFIDGFLKQMMAIQLKPNYVVALYHTMPMTQMIHESLTEHHFQHLTPFFWHKTGHGTQTPVSSLTQSVECGTFAYRPSRDKVDWHVSKDPRERHNFIDTPSVTTYRKDANGVIINQCQKPPAVSKWFVENHCVPGSTVLVLGAGALGDVEGAVQAHCNVVAVEQDQSQFEASGVHLVKMAAVEPKEDENQTDVVVDGSSSSIVSESVERRVQQPATQSDSQVEAGNTSPNCIDCGLQLAVGYDTNIACSRCDDPQTMHEDCAVKLDDGKWLCQECHVQEKDTRERRPVT